MNDDLIILSALITMPRRAIFSLYLEQNLEPVFGVEFLSGPEPGESGLLSRSHLALAALQKGKHVLGICE